MTRALALTPVLLLAAVLAWRVENSLDLGFHLASGRWILDHGAWPSTDIFTYTVTNHPYIDMHGLFQVLLASVHHAMGMPGVALLRVLLVIGAAGVVFATARRRGVHSIPLLLAGFTVALVAWEPRFFTRPELLTYLFLALELYLLRRHAEDGRLRWLYSLIPLQLLWTYSHALSLFGPALLGLYAAAGLLTRRRRDPQPWIALGLSCVALCLNPYGFRGVAFLFGLHRHLQSGDVFGQRISELSSPFAASASHTWPLLAFKVLLLLTFVAVAARGRRTRPFDLGLLLVFGSLAIVAIRNVPLFVIATLPVMLEAAQDAVVRLDRHEPRIRAAGRMVTPLLIVAMFWMAGQVVTGAYYAVDRRPNAFGYELSRAEFPVRTVDFLVDHGVTGPIYNHINFGGYLIQRLWPNERVFIDGRLDVMGSAFYREHERINTGPGWSVMMRRYDPNVVLIPHAGPRRVARLLSDPEWALVELDGVAALFVRNRAENAGVITEAQRRREAIRREAAARHEPLEPRRDPHWTRRWFEQRRFPLEAFGRTNGLGSLGFHYEARVEARTALLEAGRDYAPLAANYAEACFRTGLRNEALVWYRRVLELAEEYPQARERVTELERSRR